MYVGPGMQEFVTGVRLDALQAPVAICKPDGVVLAATPEALQLLGKPALGQPLGVLPRELWEELETVPAGEAVDWRPSGDGDNVLGCTRYHYADNFLLLMKEVSHKHAALSRRLHSQRLEATGRLVASVAHELRNAVASIVYSAELLNMTGVNLSDEALRETLSEMVAASRQLQSSVDSLLGYARVGPSVFIPVSLREVMTRAQGFLRSVYRDERRLEIEIAPEAEWVQGNTLTIEQIFVNLLLNAAQATPGALHVRVESEVVAAMPGTEPEVNDYVRVRVTDDGPGIPPRIASSIFQPFFSTREQGAGLGLTIAQEAAASLGGTLLLEHPGPGACFAVFLPRRMAAAEDSK